MDYTLKELLDIPRLQELLDSLDEIHYFPSAIVDMDGTILTSTGWQEICTKFHRINPDTEKKCIESNLHVGKTLSKDTPQVIYHCPMGLVYLAMPIIVDGSHVGNVISNQIFTEPPDEDFFIKRARQYGFNENEYLAAMRKVPILSEKKLLKNVTFICTFAQMFVEQGLQNKRQYETKETLRRSEETLLTMKETLQEQYEELQVNEESLREQNNELMATEEMLRIQIEEYEVSQKLLKESILAINREKEVAQRYLDIAGVMFAALNRSGEIILMNKKGSQILGHPDGELLGQNWFDVCLPEAVRERVKGVFALQLAGNLDPVEFYENHVINSKGEKRLIAFHNTLLHDEEGVSGVLFSGEDITDQRMHDDERLKIQKLESLGVLAGGIAHDFNNILTAIMGNISFAQRFIDDTQKSFKPLAEAQKASLRATELAHQLLTFARGGEPVKKVVSLQYLVNESASLVLHGSNIKGIVDIPDSIDAIEADEGQINQIFNNIIINATQAMPKGGKVKIFAQNETLGDSNGLSLPPGRYIRLTFTDEGCGISDADLKKIFDPYFTTKSAGNGLGLASVYSIVTKHGGNISANSVIGKGATFTIYLPSIGKTYEKYQSDSAVQSIGEHFGGLVLVMDDEEMIRDMATEMLEYLGYQSTAVASGTEAIAMYKEAKDSGEPFSAVIMDLTIPGGMGGKEAAEQILAIDPNACLIVSSGYSNDLIMSDYRNFGFAGAVAKPYKLSELGQLLSSVKNQGGIQ